MRNTMLLGLIFGLLSSTAENAQFACGALQLPQYLPGNLQGVVYGAGVALTLLRVPWLTTALEVRDISYDTVARLARWWASISWRHCCASM